MQAYHYAKAENVLKRANELVGVKRERDALELLHQLLKARRHRTWTKTHEKVIFLYIEICVETRNQNMAKDGLHCYRNIAQAQAPQSLESAIAYLLKLANKKAKAAMNMIGEQTLGEVEDLENQTTPEAILLQSTTTDDSTDRAEREHLVPWIRFLWEAYRTVLEVLRKIANLEKLYHATAQAAFGFCKSYKRKSEFIRLCKTLRNHVITNTKHNKEAVNGMLTKDSQELHLATRFEQLRVAADLNVWREAMDTIKDIARLIDDTKKKPAAKLMATYYQKLTQIFMVSKNLLFHAYSYKAFYDISREKNKSLTSEQKTAMASAVLLAAMAIPAEGRKDIDLEDVEKENNRQMAELLEMEGNPTRTNLIEALVKENILDDVMPEVKKIFELLEKDFQPLTLVERVKPLLDAACVNPTLAVYRRPIKVLLVVRLLDQLSQVYYSVRLEKLYALLAGLGESKLKCEMLIVKAIHTRQINVENVQIDHKAGCVRFGENVMEEKRTKHQLQHLASGLARVVAVIARTSPDVAFQKKRQEAAASARATVLEAHRAILKRKELIEKRKDEYEKQLGARRKREEMKKQVAEQTRRKMEEDRLRKQAEEREQQKIRRVEEELKLRKLKEEMANLGGDAKALDGDGAMTEATRRKMIDDTRKKVAKAAEVHTRKIQAAAKKVDVMVRALREREVPLRVAEQKKFAEDAEAKEAIAFEEGKKAAAKEHEMAVAEKKRFARMHEHREAFESVLLERWNVEYAKMREEKEKERRFNLRIAKIKRAEARMLSAKREMDRKRAEMEKRRELEELEARRIAEENAKAKEREARKAAEEKPSGPQKYVPKFRRKMMEEGDRGDSGGRWSGSGRNGGDDTRRNDRWGGRDDNYKSPFGDSRREGGQERRYGGERESRFGDSREPQRKYGNSRLRR